MSQEEAVQARQPKDWELIERDWRAGVKTKAQMASQYGVSRAAMDKRFAKQGIERNLGGKIRAKAEADVAKSLVPEAEQAQADATERDIVEANAAMQTRIILSHRQDIQRSRRLSMRLLDELEQQTDCPDLIEELAGALHNPDDKGMARRVELLDRLTSLSSRTSTMKSLVDSLRGLVAMERQAFGLDEKEEDSDIGSGVEDVIARVKAKNGGD